MRTDSMLERIRAFFSDQGRGGRGQAIVEFAIAFPLQLFITFGIMQLILLYVSGLVVNYAAFRACRAALVGKDPRVAAQIVLSPLAGTHLDGEDRAKCPTVTIPGWGELHNSDLAWAKTLVWEVEYEDPQQQKDLTVVVEFDQELVFPVVDALFATFFRNDTIHAENALAFGDQEPGFADKDYLNRDPAWDPGEKQLKPGRGSVREIGGAYHFLVARECTMYRQFAANFAEGGTIDVGAWMGEDE